MRIIQFIQHLFGVQVYSYEEIQKKDDDFGNAKVTQWMTTHPITAEITTWNNERINAYGKKILSNLEGVPITAEVQDRLIKIAQTSCRVQNYLANHLPEYKLNADNETAKNLHWKLVFTYSNKV